MVKQGRDVEEEYRKVVCSVYLACKAVRYSSLIGKADAECVARSVKDLNCVAWRQKLMGKCEAIPKELLIDEEEDPQVAIETKEIPEEEIYDWIKTDMDRLPELKCKELRVHIQGILRENTLTHKHAAKVANHLADASRLLTTLGMIVLANATARPLIGIHLPLMDTFIEEAKVKHEGMVQKWKVEYRPIDDICVDQNLPRLAWE